MEMNMESTNVKCCVRFRKRSEKKTIANGAKMHVNSIMKKLLSMPSSLKHAVLYIKILQKKNFLRTLDQLLQCNTKNQQFIITTGERRMLVMPSQLFRFFIFKCISETYFCNISQAISTVKFHVVSLKSQINFRYMYHRLPKYRTKRDRNTLLF